MRSSREWNVGGLVLLNISREVIAAGQQMMARDPHTSPIRRVPLLYNIWDSRAEGLATAMEELMLQAGLFDKRPRAKELVYNLVAMRCARDMGDLQLIAQIRISVFGS